MILIHLIDDLLSPGIQILLQARLNFTDRLVDLVDLFHQCVSALLLELVDTAFKTMLGLVKLVQDLDRFVALLLQALINLLK